ncbi:MAG: hypothetical protein M3P50_01910 [Actinomycetota bacterium]|nr:hypothetical protein [Actinomycetota bacterium]
MASNGRVADIAATVGETASGAASAVADKAGDAPSAIGDATSNAASAVGDAATHAAGTVKDAAPSKQQLRRGVDRVAQLAQESPFGLVITGACVGFLTGMLPGASASRLEAQAGFTKTGGRRGVRACDLPPCANNSPVVRTGGRILTRGRARMPC